MRTLFFLLLALCLPWSLSAEYKSVETKDDGRFQWEPGTVHDGRVTVRIIFEPKEDGTLRIVGEDTKEGTVHQSKTYEFEVRAGTRLETVLWFPVRGKGFRTFRHMGSFGGHWIGQFGFSASVDGRVLLKRRLRPYEMIQGQPIRVGLIGPRGSAGLALTGSTFRTITGRDNRIDVSRYNPVGTPNSRFGWTGTDIVVIDDLPDNKLTPRQQSALEDYVLNGGNLVWISGSKSKGTPLEKFWTAGLEENRLTRRGRGLVLMTDGRLFNKMAEDSRRGTAVRPFLDAGRYLKPAENLNDPLAPPRFPVHHEMMTADLFDPPDWEGSMFIIFGSIATLVFARFWSQRGNRRVFFPVVIAVVSGAWLIVIYIYGTIHHGMGTTSRSVVTMVPLDDRKVLCTESWGLMTSFGTKKTYSTPADTELIMLDSLRGIRYRGGEPGTLEDVPIRIWKPTAFVAQSVRPVNGRLSLESQALSNDTKWNFDGVIVYNGAFLVGRDVKKGEMVSLRPFLDENGRPVAKYQSTVLLEVQRQFEIEDDDFINDVLTRTLRGMVNKKQDVSWVLAWGRDGLTLLDETDDHDETLMVWHDDL